MNLRDWITQFEYTDPYDARWTEALPSSWLDIPVQEIDLKWIETRNDKKFACIQGDTALIPLDAEMSIWIFTYKGDWTFMRVSDVPMVYIYRDVWDGDV